MKAPVLILRLESPLMSYGTTALDASRPTGQFPSLSMLTGLLAQALGWTHHSRAPLVQRLQERISYAARSERLYAGQNRLTDEQNAQLDGTQVAWTTTGKPEKRAGDAATYNTPHRLKYEYLTDVRTTVALRLSHPDESPTAEDLAHALTFPAGVLYIGRKPCVPSEPIFQGIIAADSLLEALAETPSASIDAQDPLLWDGSEEHPDAQALNQEWQHDLKDWANQLHTGRRRVTTGLIANRQAAGYREEAP